MKFFFHTKLARQLRRTDVPVRDAFLGNLRSSLIAQAEEDHASERFTMIKHYSRAFTVAGAFAVLGIMAVVAQYLRHDTATGVLNIPQVLAESIANTFQLGNTTGFVHQKIHISETLSGRDATPIQFEAWNNGGDSRWDLSTGEPHLRFSYLISTEDDQSCTYMDLPAAAAQGEGYTFNGGHVTSNVECNQTFEVQMAPLEPGDLSVQDMRIVDATDEEKTENPGLTAILEWSSPIPPDQMRVSYSRNNSGYDDAGGMVWEFHESSGVYAYRELVYALEPREDETHLGDYETQMVRFSQLDGENLIHSPVYQMHLDTKQIRQMSADEIATARHNYAIALRDQTSETRSSAEMYDDLFGQAIALKDQLGDLTPLSQTDELYQGQQAVRVRYALTDEQKSEEEFVDFAEVEFVVNVQDKKILAYSFYNSAGEAVSQASVEVSEVVTGIDPATFFSVANWKKDLGVE